MRKTRLSILAVGLCGLMSGCEQAEEIPFALGTLERDRIELTAESIEPVTEILVREGDTVEAGDVILRQDSERIAVQIQSANAEKQLAEARLEELVNGPRPQEMDRVRARIAAAETRIRTAGLELKRERDLREKQYATESRIDILQGQVDEAIANRKEAEAMLDELLEGTRREQIAQATHNVEIIDARISSLTIDRERLNIKSPVKGMVETLPVELGERPALNVTVAVVLAEAPVYARIYVPETLRTRLSVGSRANVSIDGRPSPLPGSIRWLAADAVFTPYFALNQSDRSRLSYLAEVIVENGRPSSLPVGVPVQVTFPEVRYD